MYSMTSIHDLPNEVFLDHIFTLLPLQSFISARAVSQRWRALAAASSISPARRALFNVYMSLTSSNAFLESRPWIRDNVKSFRREIYVKAILEQHSVVPDDFITYILEWPERAVLPGSWPGLPFGHEVDENTVTIKGCNQLARLPPTLSRLEYMSRDRSLSIPGMLVHEGRGFLPTVWLVMGNQKDVCGKVFAVRQPGDVVYHPAAYADGECTVFDSWCAWMKYQATMLDAGEIWESAREYDEYWRRHTQTIMYESWKDGERC